MRVIIVMDDYWPSQTVRILSSIVRVVPVCTWLVNLLQSSDSAELKLFEVYYLEIVGESLPWPHCAL